MEHFRLGYVASPIGGDSDDGDKRYKGYLTIPYITVSGVAGLRFKRVSGDGPKALAYDGSIARPYNVGALSLRGPIFFAEGEPDTWAAHQSGLNVIGFPGVDTWKRIWARGFRFLSTVEGGPGLYILEQGDTENMTKIKDGKKIDLGYTPAQLLSDTIRKDLEGAKPIPFPPGMDVNDMLRKEGPAAVRDWVGLDYE